MAAARGEDGTLPGAADPVSTGREPCATDPVSTGREPRATEPARVGGAVLAGGRSRRMGQDKAGLAIGGRTLLERATSALAAALGPNAPIVAVGSPARTSAGGTSPGGTSAGVGVAAVQPEPDAPAVPRGMDTRPAAAPAPSSRMPEHRPGPDAPAGGWIPDRRPGAGPLAGGWIPDRRPGAGPLAGLEAALGWAEPAALDAVLLVGVDHPWLEPAVLRLLVERLTVAEPPSAGARTAKRPPLAADGPDGVVLGTGDGPLLLLGVYRTRALPVVAGLLDQGERRLQALQHHLDLEVLAPSAWHHLDPSGATAVDVDDPVTLALARRRHAAGDQPDD